MNHPLKACNTRKTTLPFPNLPGPVLRNKLASPLVGASAPNLNPKNKNTPA